MVAVKYFKKLGATTASSISKLGGYPSLSRVLRNLFLMSLMPQCFRPLLIKRKSYNIIPRGF